MRMSDRQGTFLAARTDIVARLAMHAGQPTRPAGRTLSPATSLLRPPPYPPPPPHVHYANHAS